MILLSIILILAGLAVAIWGELLLLGVGMIVLGVMLLLTKILDGEGAGIIWGIGIVGYVIFLLAMLLSGKVWRTIGIIVLCVVIAAILIAVIVILIIQRNKLMKLKTEVDAAKSKARIAKHKYITATRKTLETEDDHGRGGGGIFVGAYGVTANMIEKLADNYEQALRVLTNAIEEYNLAIKHFPTSLVAFIFRYKKEQYVDEDNLDNAANLNGFDDTDI